MPDTTQNSNSQTEFEVIYTISNLTTSMSYHPTLFEPAIQIDFTLTGNSSGMIHLEKMEYCLLGLINGTYPEKTDEDVFINLGNLNAMKARRQIMYRWGNQTNQEYLSPMPTGRDVSVFIALKPQEYISNDFWDVENKQLHLKLTFCTYEQSGQNMVTKHNVFYNDNPFAITKTTKQSSDGRINTPIKTTCPNLVSVKNKEKYINGNSLFFELDEHTEDVAFYSYIINNQQPTAWLGLEEEIVVNDSELFVNTNSFTNEILTKTTGLLITGTLRKWSNSDESLIIEYLTDVFKWGLFLNGLLISTVSEENPWEGQFVNEVGTTGSVLVSLANQSEIKKLIGVNLRYRMTDDSVALDDGEYNIVINARDEFFNFHTLNVSESAGKIIKYTIIRATEKPFDCELNVFGQNGNSDFAGIDIQPDGSFKPNRVVNVVFFGNSNLPLTCEIFSNEDSVYLPLVTVTKDTDNNIQETIISDVLESTSPSTGNFEYKDTKESDKNRQITELRAVLNGRDFGESLNKTISVKFTDVAGNETVISKTIVLNNRILMCDKKNLRKEGSEYSHVVLKENAYGSHDTIPRLATLNEDEFTRKWGEIYFPESQGPKMIGNTIDVEWARINYEFYEINGTFDYPENQNYGIIQMEKRGGVYEPKTTDGDGSYISIWNSQKHYSNHISRNKNNLWFRVIDNTGEGNVKISFERFDMRLTPGDMPNPSAGGYKGDVVMIYNAQHPDCLSQKQNADGTISYDIDGVNTALMDLLAVYSGNPGAVFDFVSGANIKSNDTTGAFDAEFECQRICIIVCTDSSKESSGFKIKAGKKINKINTNYDVDEINGEVWYHGETDAWHSSDKDIVMYYDYYDSRVNYNHDNGYIILNNNDISENSAITCSYAYYKKLEDYTDEDRTRQFVSSDDDFYENIAPSVYVKPLNKNLEKNDLFSYDLKNSGKLIDSYWAIDKDRGVLEINKVNSLDPNKEWDNVPFNTETTQDSDGNSITVKTYPMRMLLDYTHHTFYRLSNDGYGNVKFEDKVIVADETPVYPDATWADIRIINEGDAILEDGQLVFKCRGETDGATSDEVTKPLDINRPWDVQEGIKDVTWDRCKIRLSETYDLGIFKFAPSREDLRAQYNIAAEQDVAVLSVGKNPYIAPGEALYGRVIWNLAGETDNGEPEYPEEGLVVGRKSWSVEISGRFYTIQD